MIIEGKNPMWDVNVSLDEYHPLEPGTGPILARFADMLAGRGPKRPIYGAYSSSPGAIFPLVGQSITPDPTKETTYYIDTEARNGNFREALKVRLNPDKRVWEFSCTLSKEVGVKMVSFKAVGCNGSKWIGLEIHVPRPPS